MISHEPILYSLPLLLLLFLLLLLQQLLLLVLLFLLLLLLCVVPGKLFHSGLPHKSINPIELCMDALMEMQKRFYQDFKPHPLEEK
jgi:hypothetical protein